MLTCDVVLFSLIDQKGIQKTIAQPFFRYTIHIMTSLRLIAPLSLSSFVLFAGAFQEGGFHQYH